MANIKTVLLRALLLMGLTIGPVNAATLIARSGDGLFEATTQNTILDFKNPATGEITDRWELDKPATSIALNEWGGMVYLGHADGTVRAFETTSLRERFHLFWFNKPVIGLSLWNDDLMVVDTDGSVVILDAKTGEEREDSPRDLDTPSPTAPIAAKLFSRVARVGYADGRVLEYDRVAKTWTPVPGPRTPQAVHEAVHRVPEVIRTVTRRAVQSTASSRRVCSTGSDGNTVCQATTAPASYQTYSQRVSQPDLPETLSRGHFPWPPPPYSDAYVVYPYQLAAWTIMGGDGVPRPVQTYEDISRKIQDALRLGAYTAPRYYRIDEGFVIVTQIEEIDEYGAWINPEYERWWNGEAPRPDPFTFSLRAFFDALANAPVGRYRLIAFALNTGECPVQPCTRPAAIDAASARELLQGGELTLPTDIGNERLDPQRHNLSVLVYAFEKPNKTLPATISKRLSATTHLTAARIMAGLP